MRQFVAVAEELHFGKAARRLNMAQPPLSQAIRRLELELEVELFDRSRRAVALTEPGRVFLVEARRTLMQAELAQKMAQRAAAKMVEARIGFIGPALYRTLPGLVVRYRAAFPDVEVRLAELPSERQLKELLVGDLDVGFITAPTDRIAGIETLVVERTYSMVAVPADWDLAQQDSISCEDLAKQPLILPPSKYALHFAEILSMFKTMAATPRITQETMQMNTTISLVGAGLGCSILTRSAASTRPRNVKFLRIEDPPPYRPWELALVWAKDHLNEVSAQFVQTARDHVAANPQLFEDPEDVV